jgi:hypothetical protein
MTPLLGILALLLIPITYRASRLDDYHAPVTSAVIAIVRTAAILLLPALILTWPSPASFSQRDKPVVALLVDGQRQNPHTLTAGIAKELESIKSSGFEPLFLIYGRPSSHVPFPEIPGYDPVNYSEIEEAMLRVHWEKSRDEGLSVAVFSEYYPTALKKSPWNSMGITWIKASPSPATEINNFYSPSAVFTDQNFGGEYTLTEDSSPDTILLTVDDDPEPIPLEEGSGNSSQGTYSLSIGDVGSHVLRLQLFDEEGYLLDEKLSTVNVLARPQVHYISPEGSQTPMARFLVESGFSVEMVSPISLLSQEPFPNFKTDETPLVILDAVPINYLTENTLANLKTAVRKHGTDLLIVTGGQLERSSGESAIEEFLPVKFGKENDSDKDKTLALVAVVDASLSMFYKIGGGGGWGHSMDGEGGWGMKIKMAKKSLLNLSEAMPETNPFGVLTVTNSPSWVFQPSLPRDTEKETDLIGRIKAYGPGINLYSGLLEAFRKLAQIPAESKHILVFLDTADVDEYQVNEVGTVWDLLKELNEEGITVSLIGFGRSGDQHIPQLNRFADESGGYFYLTTDVTEIPGFSLKDLDLISENLISYKYQKTMFYTHDFPDIDSLPEVHGQALTTLKPGASLLAWTDMGFPLIATWRYGKGSVTVFTADNGRALATDWYGADSPWEQILARTGERSEDRPSFYFTAKSGSKVLLARKPRDSSSLPQATARFADGENRKLEPGEVVPGGYAVDLSGHDNRLLSVDIFWPSAASSVDKHTYVVTPPSPARLSTEGKPGEFSLISSTVSKQDKMLDPTFLRLLILLVVLLVAIDEMFRPPAIDG